MKLGRSILLGLIITFLAISSALAEQEFTIEADSISYDQVNHIVSASGNVTIVFDNLTVVADNLNFNSQTKKLVATNEVTMIKEGMRLRGTNLAYNVAKSEGASSNVSLVYQGVYLKGKKVVFAPDEIKMLDADFSTCDLPNPHYQVKAQEINIYKESGWIVAYWGFFWVNGIPTVPIPTYLYDLNAAEDNEQNLPPFPEMGSNQVDGNYITERLVLNAKKDWNSRLLISYYSKKGFGLGAEADYILDSRNSGELRIGADNVEHGYGGITHKIKGHHNDTLTINTTYRERENYQRISRLPGLTLDYKFNPSLTLDLANILEESSGLHYIESRIRSHYDQLLLKNDLGQFKLALDLDHRAYDDKIRWHLATDTLSLTKDFGWVRTTLSQMHYLYDYGASPFIFENYQYKPQDTVGLRFESGSVNSTSAINFEYYLPDMTPKDLDYLFSAKIHCYDIILGYRVIRQEVVFSFSLVNN